MDNDIQPGNAVLLRRVDSALHFIALSGDCATTKTTAQGVQLLRNRLLHLTIHHILPSMEQKNRYPLWNKKNKAAPPAPPALPRCWKPPNAGQKFCC